MDKDIEAVLAEMDRLLVQGKAEAAKDGLQAALTTATPDQAALLQEKLGLCGFLLSDMFLAGQSYWLAAQNDTVLRNQLAHLSSYLFCLHYLPQVTQQDIAQAAQLYNHAMLSQFAGMAPEPSLPARQAKGGKISIGYLSADWRSCSLANFLLPLVRDYNAEQFKVHAFALNEDYEQSRLYQAGTAIWHNLSQASTLEAAELISATGIDILVDLAGHTNGGSSLMIMAHRPAPVQISGLGWIDTTGLSTIDYYLTDQIAAPLDSQEDIFFSEQLLRLDCCQFCYTPLEPATPPKHVEHARFRYGCLGNFDKLTMEALACWQEILAANPYTELFLQDTTEYPARKSQLQSRLAQLGFPMDRVQVELASPHYLTNYDTLDLILDSFPYGGGTTTCIALSRGVPVLTLAGHSNYQRIGASILTYGGLPELVASSREEYISLACSLAHKPLQLTQLRHKALAALPRLSDARAYMARLEKLYQMILG